VNAKITYNFNSKLELRPKDLPSGCLQIIHHLAVVLEICALTRWLLSHYWPYGTILASHKRLYCSHAGLHQYPNSLICDKNFTISSSELRVQSSNLNLWLQNPKLLHLVTSNSELFLKLLYIKRVKDELAAIM